MAFPQLLLVKFENYGKTTAVSSGTTLLEAALRLGVPLPSVCSGQSYCGECKLKVMDGKMTPLTQDEVEVLSDEERRMGVRLACCARVLSSARIRV